MIAVAALALFFFLGLSVGSFINVVVHRLPKGESLVYPPSHCPYCLHRLNPLELVPVLSWLVLRGRCRYCDRSISPRYPLVELSIGFIFLLIAWWFPVFVYGILPLGLAVVMAVLMTAALIDLEINELPDGLIFAGIVLSILLALLRPADVPLPDLGMSLQGAGIAAGLLALISGYGAWVLRRFREPRVPDFPLGYMQIHLAALLGFWLGPIYGLVGAVVSGILNALLGRLLRVPDGLTLGGLLLSFFLAICGVRDFVSAVAGALEAAGWMALVAGIYWACRRSEPTEDEDADPVAMGFGDVKLAGAMGALLGWQAFLIAFGLAIFIGIIFALFGRARRRLIPFGPPLVLGTFIALFLGPEPLGAYIRALGLS